MRITPLVLLLAASPALADTSIGEGLTVSVENQKLLVHRGKDWAQLAANAMTRGMAASVDDKGLVDLEVFIGDCASSRHLRFTRDQLRARIENRSAYLLHLAKDYKGAAAGYARAVTLDPKWQVAALNLASADVEQKDLAGAMQALAPWLAAEPMPVLAKIAGDSELRPLLARPELAALHAKQRGTAKHEMELPAFSPERNLVAVRRSSYAVVTCGTDESVEIYDAVSGKLAASLVLLEPDDFACSRTKSNGFGGGAATDHVVPKARLDERAAGVDEALATLGFSPASVEAATVEIESTNGAEKYKARFAKAKLGLVVAGNQAHALRGNTSLGTATVGAKLNHAWYLPDAKAIFIEAFNTGSEVCGLDPWDSSALIPIK